MSSLLRIRNRIRIGSGFNQVIGSGSGTGIQIWIQHGENEPPKKLWDFKFWSAGCSLLWAGDFSCSLDVLYGGLGMSNFDLKNIKFCLFSCTFLSRPEKWIRNCFGFLMAGTIGHLFISFKRPDVASNSIKTLKNLSIHCFGSWKEQYHFLFIKLLQKSNVAMGVTFWLV